MSSTNNNGRWNDSWFSSSSAAAEGRINTVDKCSINSTGAINLTFTTHVRRCCRLVVYFWVKFIVMLCSLYWSWWGRDYTGFIPLPSQNSHRRTGLLFSPPNSRWQMQPGFTICLDFKHCPFPHNQPIVCLLSISQSVAPTSFPSHVASMHVCFLFISFSCAPLISLCSWVQTQWAASPTLKITTPVWQGWGEKGVFGEGRGAGRTYSSQSKTKPTFL